MMEQLIFGGFYDLNHEVDILHTRNYGVTIQLHQKKQLDQIRFRIKMTCSKKAENWMWEVTLDKTALYLNDKIPNSFKQRLDVDFGTTVLYPISIWVTPSGIIKDISDTSFSAIINRFKTFKKKTLQENSGASIEQYVLSLEKGIASKKKIIRHLTFDWFWALYFAPIYDATAKKLTMPLQTNSPRASYNGDIIEKTELSYYNTRQLTFDGKVSKSYFEQYPSKKKYKAGIKLCYDFDSDTGIIANITSDQSIMEKQNIIQRILVNVDHLPERNAMKSLLDKEEDTQKPTFKDKVLKWWNV
ncbi:hypothetical protein ATE84_1445 [Aquimarina sp. MAR_2010_214]|uniref:hypothetical protein n=1 Tax=Aquimarina sp. MAR_2010_214 TaxID=1250026 RepID=UPI000CC42403|nr:hypothetical protein [Aquimarina sp. MAR_2010_214]PKV49421.1 hypothetical protein ATE84_1445 [Aquimarina sp. MAR_2010_214]